MKDETQRRYEKDMPKNNKLIDIFNATGAQLRKDENAHWVIYKAMASGVVIEGRHLSSVSQAILNYGKAFIEYVTGQQPEPQKPDKMDALIGWLDTEIKQSAIIADQHSKDGENIKEIRELGKYRGLTRVKRFIEEQNQQTP